MDEDSHVTVADETYDDPNVADTGDEDHTQDVGDPEEADTEDKPASEDEPQDDGMDLFGEDEVADEVKHEET